MLCVDVCACVHVYACVCLCVCMRVRLSSITLSTLLTVLLVLLHSVGLCVLSKTRSRPIIAFPSRDDGSLQITDLVRSDGVTIAAHSNGLECLALSADARQIATASVKGTCIRIFDVSASQWPVKNHLTLSAISGVSTSPDVCRVCCPSSHTDVHGRPAPRPPSRGRSGLDSMLGVLPRRVTLTCVVKQTYPFNHPHVLPHQGRRA